ncbi:hypothetical protein QOT17_020774 [Balamuthia mandrillaris]
MTEQPSKAQKIATLKHCLNPCLLESVSNMLLLWNTEKYDQAVQIALTPFSMSCLLHPTSRHSAAECPPHLLPHHQDILHPPINTPAISAQCPGILPAALNASQVQTSSSQQPASASLLPSSPSPSSALPPFGINQPFTNAPDATTKQEFMEAVRHTWEIQVAPEAIHAEGLDIDDNDDVEDNCEDKVEPPIMAPILLNRQHATAFIDSGASHSFISPAAAERYLHPTSCKHYHIIISNIDNMEITLGDRSTTRVTCCVAHVRIDCGSHKLFHHFFIIPLQGEHEILFGRDIM